MNLTVAVIGLGYVGLPLVVEFGKATDHRHRHRSVKPYAYHDAAALVADFWSEVEAAMREQGVWS